MTSENDLDAVIEELLRIEARIICLEALYTKFVNITNRAEDVGPIEEAVGDMLRNERRKLVGALNAWIGELS